MEAMKNICLPLKQLNQADKKSNVLSPVMLRGAEDMEEYSSTEG